MSRKLLLALAALAALAWPSLASAYSTPAIEAFFGASNIVATTGNGRVTLGVSDEGDVTVLTWPSPSYYDHLQYVASNDLQARYLEHAGAQERMGIFSGLLVTLSSGESRFLWLRDEPWTAAVAYTADDSAVVVTTYFHPGWRLTVHQFDFVPPDSDFWVRRYVVEQMPSSDVQSAWILAYSNLSPSQTKVAELPIADFAFEQHQDFIAAWDLLNKAVFHFHPGDTGVLKTPLGIARIADNMKRDFGPMGELLTEVSATPGDVVDHVFRADANYAPGVYIWNTSVPSPVDFQIGEDKGPICDQIDALADNIVERLDSGTNPGFTIPSSVVSILRCGTFDPLQTPREENLWFYEATDAYDDALDGQLESNPLAAAQANSVIKVPLGFENRIAEASVIYAFGDTRATSYAAMDVARELDFAAAMQAVETNDAAYVASLDIPSAIDGDFRAFVERAFLNLRVGTDAESGAVVASISRQPSYHVDWPRDGVFFNVALDLAGQHELVEKRLRFYASTMRREPVSPTPILDVGPPGWPDAPNRKDFPPGTWEMNYYGDGTPGGNIRLEIDNTALVVWNMVEHVGHLETEAARLAWLDEMWPTIEASADFLAWWRDPETGLIWPSNEDDHIEYTQGMQGSGTTFAALRAAAMAARALGHEEHASRWAARASELRRAILEHLVDANGNLVAQPAWSEIPQHEPTEWVAWPIRLLPWDDPRMREEVLDGLQRHVDAVRGEHERGQYPTKAATSVALVFAGEPEADLGLEIAQRLATEIAHPTTKMVGEVFATDDLDGDGTSDQWLNLQGNPHLWSAILVFITAKAYYEPEAFDRYLQVLPEVVIDEGGEGAMDPAPQPDVGGAPDLGAPDAADAGFSLSGAEVRGASCNCATRSGVPVEGLFWILVIGAVFRNRTLNIRHQRSERTMEVQAPRSEFRCPMSDF